MACRLDCSVDVDAFHVRDYQPADELDAHPRSSGWRELSLEHCCKPGERPNDDHDLLVRPEQRQTALRLVGGDPPPDALDDLGGEMPRTVGGGERIRGSWRGASRAPLGSQVPPREKSEREDGLRLGEGARLAPWRDPRPAHLDRPLLERCRAVQLLTSPCPSEIPCSHGRSNDSDAHLFPQGSQTTSRFHSRPN